VALRASHPGAGSRQWRCGVRRVACPRKPRDRHRSLLLTDLERFDNYEKVEIER
jgi:hypothetical protein